MRGWQRDPLLIAGQRDGVIRRQSQAAKTAAAVAHPLARWCFFFLGVSVLLPEQIRGRGERQPVRPKGREAAKEAQRRGGCNFGAAGTWATERMGTAPLYRSAHYPDHRPPLSRKKEQSRLGVICPLHWVLRTTSYR